MSSTSKDINYLSVSNVYTLYAGSDHPQEFDLQQMQQPHTYLVPDEPSQYASILKISNNISPFIFDDIYISQGHENVIDINNHASNVKITNAKIGVSGANGDQVITIKGESHDIEITGVLYTRGKRQGVDIDIGNWSDQSFGKSYNITLNLTHADGKPVNVRIGRAKGITLGGSCKKMFLPSLTLKAYWWTKWLVRKVLKIPMGTKGPSWL